MTNRNKIVIKTIKIGNFGNLIISPFVPYHGIFVRGQPEFSDADFENSLADRKNWHKPGKSGKHLKKAYDTSMGL